MNYLRVFEKNKNVKIIDHRINAKHIIKLCEGVISLPFTSTAIIAHECNIPSIYYDPSSKISGQPFEEKGIRIINNQKNLNRWFLSVKNSIKCNKNNKTRND